MDNQKFEDEKNKVSQGQTEVDNKVKMAETDKLDLQNEQPADDDENTPNNDHNPTIPRQGKGVQGMNMESGQNLYCDSHAEKKDK